MFLLPGDAIVMLGRAERVSGVSLVLRIIQPMPSVNLYDVTLLTQAQKVFTFSTFPRDEEVSWTRVNERPLAWT